MRDKNCETFFFDNLQFNFIQGALNDFDAGNSSKSTDKDVDAAEATASADTWNEEFIS